MIRREILFPEKDKTKEKKLKALKTSKGSFTDLTGSRVGTAKAAHNSPQLVPLQRSLSSGDSPTGRLARLPESFPTNKDAYVLKNECGQGATAKVWRAFCKPLQEECAIKMVDMESAGKNLDTIIHEAQLLCGLRHPNVLSILACFVEGHELWMVLPYIGGGSVESAMNYAFPTGLEERVIAPIMLQVLRALEYLHKRSIVHRDVKASNILLERSNIVLGDFGIAANMERRLDTACKADFGRYLSRTTFVGTPVWMAPEVIEQVDGHGMKADIYSFGMTVLELAIGRAPFAGMPFEVVAMNKLHHPSPKLPTTYEGRHFSADMQEVVAQCLEKDPTKRPTAAQLLKHRFFKWTRPPRDAVDELLAGVPGPVARLTSLTRRSREATAAGLDEPNPFAADERVSLGSLRNKDAQAATARFDADSALNLLHKMLQSNGVIIKTSSGSPETLNSILPVTPKTGLAAARKPSFTKRKSSFASGTQWPNLPASALQHCSGLLFASAARKGFGLQTTWGHGFIMARKTCADGRSCWSGPCYVYISSGNMHLGLGETVRESIVLYSGRDAMERLIGAGVFKMSALRFVDAVEDNMDPAAICDALTTNPQRCHGVAFRHYTGAKAWKVHGIVNLDQAANDRTYGRPVSASDIFGFKVKPPAAFNPLIDVLISCEDGRYELHYARSSDSESSFPGLKPLSTLPLPGDAKRGLPAGTLRSTPTSLNALSLDTAFSGSFTESVTSSRLPPEASLAPSSSTAEGGRHPSSQAARAELDNVLAPTPSAVCQQMPLRHSASAPLLLEDLTPVARQHAGPNPFLEQLRPPSSAFASDTTAFEMESRRTAHNDSALDLSSLDSVRILAAVPSPGRGCGDLGSLSFSSSGVWPLSQPSAMRRIRFQPGSPCACLSPSLTAPVCRLAEPSERTAPQPTFPAHRLQSEPTHGPAQRTELGSQRDAVQPFVIRAPRNVGLAWFQETLQKAVPRSLNASRSGRLLQAGVERGSGDISDGASPQSGEIGVSRRMDRPHPEQAAASVPRVAAPGAAAVQSDFVMLGLSDGGTTQPPSPFEAGAAVATGAVSPVAGSDLRGLELEPQSSAKWRPPKPPRLLSSPTKEGAVAKCQKLGSE